MIERMKDLDETMTRSFIECAGVWRVPGSMGICLTLRRGTFRRSRVDVVIEPAVRADGTPELQWAIYPSSR